MGGGASGGDRTGGIAKESSPTEIRILAYPHLNTILLLKRTTKRNITQIQRNATAYHTANTPVVDTHASSRVASISSLMVDGMREASAGILDPIEMDMSN